jgi:predicted lactoylglutathione lyase
MTRELWINLPVKDLNKSKEFFSRIGFALNEQFTGGEMVCFQIGEN